MMLSTARTTNWLCLIAFVLLLLVIPGCATETPGEAFERGQVELEFYSGKGQDLVATATIPGFTVISESSAGGTATGQGFYRRTNATAFVAEYAYVGGASSAADDAVQEVIDLFTDRGFVIETRSTASVVMEIEDPRLDKGRNVKLTVSTRFSNLNLRQGVDLQTRIEIWHFPFR